MGLLGWRTLDKLTPATMKALAGFVLILATLFLTWLDALEPKAHAAGGVPLWTNSYGQLATAVAVVVDRAGNALVTGSDYSAMFADYVTIKYSSAGLPLWTNRYGGPGSFDDQPKALAVDDSGNVFVTGTSGILGEPGDYLTVAYSNDGAPLWANRYNGTGNNRDFSRAIAVDSSGNVFVTGSSVTIASTDYATIAYSKSGVPLWTNLYNGPGNDSDAALAVAVDGSGKVFVTGGSMPDANSREYATVAYSSTGVRLWVNHYDGPVNGLDDGRAIALDKTGNVFVTGNSAGSGTTNDFATIAYSNSGAVLWTNRYNGPGNGGDIGNAIAVDSKGNVFVTGSSTGTGSGFDYATIAYSNAGVPLWTNRYNGPGNGDDIPFALALDSEGNVFVTGSSAGTGTDYDYATVAYSNAGLPLWTNRYTHSTNGNRFVSLAVDLAGNVFVTGGTSSGSTGSYVTIKYSSSMRPYLNLQRAENQIILSWTNSAFTLQSAPSITGVFTNVPSATSAWTNVTSSSQQFFRLSNP